MRCDRMLASPRPVFLCHANAKPLLPAASSRQYFITARPAYSLGEVSISRFRYRIYKLTHLLAMCWKSHSWPSNLALGRRCARHY